MMHPGPQKRASKQVEGEISATKPIGQFGVPVFNGIGGHTLWPNQKWEYQDTISTSG